MTDTNFRIHPAIGISRVGNSPRPDDYIGNPRTDYLLSPENIAGLEVRTGGTTMGGLPIPLDGSAFKSGDLHDESGRLKRQAQRFKIYQYATIAGSESYPLPADNKGTEVIVGSTVEGKTVTDIIWTVHLANKKPNCYETPEILGRDDYVDGQIPSRFQITDEALDTLKKDGVPDNVLDELRTLKDNDSQLLGDFDISVKQAIGNSDFKTYGTQINNASVIFFLRNPDIGAKPSPIQAPSPNDPVRLQELAIDAGPRAINGTDAQGIDFDVPTVASYEYHGAISTIPDYHKIFPVDNFPETLQSVQGPIDTLGELCTDSEGRLHVLGGYGRSAGWNEATDYKLTSATDNDEYYDDTADGPVHAVLVLDGGRTVQVQASAWVIVTDPAIAPQTLNIVSLWDDIYNTWVREFDLAPEIYQGGEYQLNYQASFANHVHPLLQAVSLHQWNLNLPDTAVYRHDKVGGYQEAPEGFVETFIRNINTQSDQSGFMPLSLGDVQASFLAPSQTQYFLLQQWQAGKYRKDYDQITGFDLGPGEYLDYAVLLNCLGGRFSPGIEMTFICRDEDLYTKHWKTSGTGPFRIRTDPLKYNKATAGKPFLTAGYFPGTHNSPGLEPGDASKFMSIPWHTDYNSCGTHTTVPAPESGNPQTLYWSWPSQRPLTAYLATEVSMEGGSPALGQQRYSIRGPGTLYNVGTHDPVPPQQVGRYQDINNILDHWQKIGIIVQATTINSDYPQDWYLEVGGELSTDDEVPVPLFPTYSTKPNTT